MSALKLPPEIETRLDAMARRTGRSTTSHALEAILEPIEDLEDAHTSGPGKGSLVSRADGRGGG